MRHLRVCEWQVMDFECPLPVQVLRQRLEDCMGRYILPYNGPWHRRMSVAPPSMEHLKALARSVGLWNLFFARPARRRARPAAEQPGLRPTGQDHGSAPVGLAGVQLQCHDTGNIALLHPFATPVQNWLWLRPSSTAQIRSAFAISEPDLASSDPTNL